MNKKAESSGGCFWCCVPNKRSDKYSKRAKTERKLLQEQALNNNIEATNTNNPKEETIKSQAKESADKRILLIQESPKPENEVKQEVIELAKEIELIDVKSNVSVDEQEASMLKPEQVEYAKVKGAVTDRIISNKIGEELVFNDILNNSQRDAKTIKVERDSLLMKVNGTKLKEIQEGDKENQEPTELCKDSPSTIKKLQTPQSTENQLVNYEEKESPRLDMISPSHIQSTEEDGNIKPINVVSQSLTLEYKDDAWRS